MSSIKPLNLWGTKLPVPNPWKVAIILEELDIPYHFNSLDLADLKKEPFESLNPNGRAPALDDPNTGIVIFESGAIIDYLVEITYADLMWVPWNNSLRTLVPEGYDVEKEVPLFSAWHQKMLDRESLKKVRAAVAVAKAAAS